MAALVISPEAEIDLLDIWLYIAEDHPDNADRFLDKLYIKAIKISEFNEIGIDRDDLVLGLKSFPVDNYVFYFRRIKKGIELVRVLHASRDINIQF